LGYEGLRQSSWARVPSSLMAHNGAAEKPERFKATYGESEQARLAAELASAKEKLRRQQQRAAATSSQIEELEKQLQLPVHDGGTR
ncbi:hypothetical protein, partial [Streptomyces sp. NPDC016734]